MRGLAALIFIASFFVAPAFGQASCLREHFKTPSTAGIMLTDAENLVGQVKKAQQFVRKIVVVECPFYFSKKAVAFPARGQVGIPDGEYIVYDSTWMREMVGDDLGLAYIILAHEIGHFINGDFADGGNDLLRPDQELAADRYAACAVARNGGNWASLQNLLSRIRVEEVSDGDLYKDKFTSIAAAKDAFLGCGGSLTEKGPVIIEPPPVTRPVLSSDHLQLCGRIRDAAKSLGNGNPSYLKPFGPNFEHAFVGIDILSIGTLRGYAFGTRDTDGTEVSITFDGVDKITVDTWLIGCRQQLQYDLQVQGKLNKIILEAGSSFQIADQSRPVWINSAQQSKDYIVAEARSIFGARIVMFVDR